MLKVVESEAGTEAEGKLLELDEIARAGARRMLMAALETEAGPSLLALTGPRARQLPALAQLHRTAPFRRPNHAALRAQRGAFPRSLLDSRVRCACIAEGLDGRMHCAVLAHNTLSRDPGSQLSSYE
jgi:hypothetical protein